MRKIILLFLMGAYIGAFTSTSAATAFNGNLYTEFYSYKTESPEEQSHLRSLQGFRLSVKDVFAPGLSFFGRGRLASDIADKLGTDPDFRVWGGYLQYLSPNRVILAKLGRQYNYEGIGGFTMDGIKLRIKYQNLLSLTTFAGTLPGPSFYTYDEINDWDEYNVIGGRLRINATDKIRFNASLLLKQYNNETDAQLAGVDFSYRNGWFRETARIDYDLHFKRAKLISYTSRFKSGGGHSIGFEYRFRHPTFRLSNFFSAVKSKPYHQIRFSPIYKISPDLNGIGSISYTKFKDESNVHLKIGGLYKGQTAGIVFSNGYSGTKIGAFATLNRKTSEKLSLYVRADMLSYKLDSDESDYESSAAWALGARYGVTDNLTSRGEIQALNNAAFDYDLRFYLRLEYSFYSKSEPVHSGGGDAR